MPDDNLIPKQQAMIEMWEAHMAAEFKQKDIDATMATVFYPVCNFLYTLS